MNYEKDLFIDDSALDIEWLDQPMLFMKYAKYSAQMQKELDSVKQNLEVLRAEIDTEIRKNPDKFGVDKVTEKGIEAIILTDERYQKVYGEMLDSKYELEMARNAVQAFNQRKESLENLVKLHGQSYFAGPKVPRDIHWEREEKAKKVDDKIGKRLNRNR